MLIAREKKQTNIAEYILYMWQVEDLIRAHEFDLDRLEQFIIERFDEPDSIKAEMRKWYADLIESMQTNGLEISGHLPETMELIQELTMLHRSLLNTMRDEQYRHVFSLALPYIQEFQLVSKIHGDEVHACFHGLYSQLLLKLQQKPISQETQDAFNAFGAIATFLAREFHRTNPAMVD